MIDQLRRRYEAITAAPHQRAQLLTPQPTTPHLPLTTSLHHTPDLAALPATVRTVVDARFEGLTAHDTRREVYGTVRRTILTHSPELHESQARGFEGTTLAKAGTKLDALATTLARGKTRRPPRRVEAEDRRTRGVVLPNAPLDRAQHPRPHVHLRPRPPDRPPHATPSPPSPPAPSVPALLGELAAAETVLLYQGDRGRPKARRMLTETNPTQDTLT